MWLGMHFQISFVYELFVEWPHECEQCTHHIYSLAAPESCNEVHIFFKRTPNKFLASGLLYNILPDQSQVSSCSTGCNLISA